MESDRHPQQPAINKYTANFWPSLPPPFTPIIQYYIIIIFVVTLVFIKLCGNGIRIRRATNAVHVKRAN